jgi:hypothetical protein
VQLYPHCTVSASYPSSLNPLARVFEKPLVVYDWWGIVTGTHPAMPSMRIPGARYASNAAELEEAVRAALRESNNASALDAGGLSASTLIFETIAARLGA